MRSTASAVSRSRHIALAATLLAAGLGLGACGQTSAGGGPGATAPAASTTAVSTSGTSAPVPSGVVPTMTAPTTGGGGAAATSGPVTVTGVPEEGVERGCVLVRPYLLVGGDDAARALLATGVKVTVTGHLDPDQMSYCQQGTILVVESVRAAG